MWALWLWQRSYYRKVPFGNTVIPAPHKGDSMKTLWREQRLSPWPAPIIQEGPLLPAFRTWKEAKPWSHLIPHSHLHILSANSSPASWNISPSSERTLFIPAKSTLIPLPSTQTPPTLHGPTQSLTSASMPLRETPSQRPWCERCSLGLYHMATPIPTSPYSLSHSQYVKLLSHCFSWTYMYFYGPLGPQASRRQNTHYIFLNT